MDFELDEAQEAVRAAARAILDDHVTTARLRELEAGDEPIDRALWAKLADANLLGVALPEDVGGSGYGLLELAVLLAEVGRRVAPVPALPTLAMAALPIARHGTVEQRQRLLPGVVDGSSFLTAGLQEGTSRHPLAPATTARPEGGSWLLTGQKVAVPWSTLADRIVVTARTGQRTVGVFVVDPATPGVHLEHGEATNRQPVGVLTLTDAEVAADDVLGDPTDGLQVAQDVYQHAVAGACAVAVGVLDEALRMTAAYISEREQFGRPIATFQGAALRAADAYVDTQAISVATWSAVWRLATGRPCRDELAIAKFWVAEAGQRVAHACQHLHGGVGVDLDYPVHRHFLWAKHLELLLGGGADQLLDLGASLAGADA